MDSSFVNNSVREEDDGRAGVNDALSLVEASDDEDDDTVFIDIFSFPSSIIDNVSNLENSESKRVFSAAVSAEE